jgi:hypothetical protein
MYLCTASLIGTLVAFGQFCELLYVLQYHRLSPVLLGVRSLMGDSLLFRLCLIALRTVPDALVITRPLLSVA